MRACMQAQAVELLCRCDDIPDDGIELKVLKGLLTAVTSNAVHVHGQALLLVSYASVSCAPYLPLARLYSWVQASAQPDEQMGHKRSGSLWHA